jgi:hypothetical protein
VTGLDLVTESHKVLGLVAVGETLTAAEATDGLSSLNRMLSAWSTDGLLIYTRTREAVAMTPGTASYTMGASGTYSATRALVIEEALIRDETVSPALESPMEILSLAEWAAIPQKDSSSAVPTKLFHDSGYPLDTVTVYPKPTAAHKLVLYSQKPLTAISALTTDISLPPGYEEALIYNLAIRLAPSYSKAVPDSVVAIATESKEGLKRANYKPSYLKADDVLLSNGRAFNIFTGDSS